MIRKTFGLVQYNLPRLILLRNAVKMAFMLQHVRVRQVVGCFEHYSRIAKFQPVFRLDESDSSTLQLVREVLEKYVRNLCPVQDESVSKKTPIRRLEPLNVNRNVPSQ